MKIKSSEDIKRLGTILFVGAHPDDETFTAAGIMAQAVKNGQKVKAGDKLAAVGPSGAADCTAPHLHIDHLPKPANFRVSCAGASCSSKGFIDIQPVMKKLYDQMVAAQSGGAM